MPDDFSALSARGPNGQRETAKRIKCPSTGINLGRWSLLENSKENGGLYAHGDVVIAEARVMRSSSLLNLLFL